MIEIALGWIFFSILVGVLASRFGRSGAGWFFLALIISPLFAGLLVVCLPSNAEPPVVRVLQEPGPNPTADGPAADGKKCPDCAETVQKDARICRFCRHEFTDATPFAPSG